MDAGPLGASHCKEARLHIHVDLGDQQLLTSGGCGSYAQANRGMPLVSISEDQGTTWVRVNREPIVEVRDRRLLWVTVILNGRIVPGASIRRITQPAGKIPSGFELERHELVEVTPPSRMLVPGENALAFHIPRFPSERDPYIHIYELVVETQPAS